MIRGELIMAYTSIDGYDNESARQSSKEEKWERSARATKWIILSLVIVCSLIFGVKVCVQDTMIKMRGNSIVAEFKKGTTFHGINEDGNAITIMYQNQTKIQILKPIYDSNNQVSFATESRDYGKNSMIAFTDNNGISHIVKIMFTMLSPFQTDKVTVYYYGDDIKSARALNSIWFWAIFYIVLIPLLYMCMRVAYRIIYPKTHISTEVEDNHIALKNKISELWKRKM